MRPNYRRKYVIGFTIRHNIMDFRPSLASSYGNHQNCDSECRHKKSCIIFVLMYP